MSENSFTWNYSQQHNGMQLQEEKEILQACLRRQQVGSQ